jgi:glycosyltransferase involved in cell wall biosynthesis
MPSTELQRQSSVTIVVPVYNEEHVLEASIRRLDSHLHSSFPFDWRIVIADNASTDGTALLGARLAVELPGVELLRLEQKGRGRALKAAWLASDADVVCYMDVDLSTDLRALLPLVAPLVSGHSDVAIGSRLTHSAHVVRGPKRELISRIYNRLLRISLSSRFSDAQCGFKAVRGDVAQRLLPQVDDDGWFFDTELLVLAQREGLRIHEVPVDWVDDPDSRVDVLATALTDLRGIVRLLAAARLTRFLIVGVCSTIAFALLYLLLRGPLGAQVANAVALALTAVANTAANRRFTFGLRGRRDLARQYAGGAVVYALTLGLAAGALALLSGIDPDPSRVTEVFVLVTSSLAATATRYVALRSWVFANRSGPGLTDRAIAVLARAGQTPGS